jgi:hypothetical protein
MGCCQFIDIYIITILFIIVKWGDGVMCAISEGHHWSKLHLNFFMDSSNFFFCLLDDFTWVPWIPWSLRVALHLQAGPIRCVRGLKSSLVIGQKAQIGPNPFTPRGRANLVIWFFKLKIVCYDTAEAHWIGCTQNEGPMSYITKKTFLNKVWF